MWIPRVRCRCDVYDVDECKRRVDHQGIGMQNSSEPRGSSIQRRLPRSKNGFSISPLSASDNGVSDPSKCLVAGDRDRLRHLDGDGGVARGVGNQLRFDRLVRAVKSLELSGVIGVCNPPTTFLFRGVEGKEVYAVLER